MTGQDMHSPGASERDEAGAGPHLLGSSSDGVDVPEVLTAAGETVPISEINRFTRDYIRAFDEEVPKASNSGALMAAMERRFPNAGLKMSLEIDSKVAKHEMIWEGLSTNGLARSI